MTPMHSVNHRVVGHISMALSAVALALAFTGGQPANAQAQNSNKVTFPAGLKWQMMPMVAFDFPGYHEGTPALRKAAMDVWGDVIQSLPKGAGRNGSEKFPSFVLLTGFENSGRRYIFSVLDAAGAVYPKCQDAPNSSGLDTTMYSVCSMRLVIEDKASGQKQRQEFGNFCHLFVDDPDQPAAKNHTAIAVDSRSMTAYFRVIQYGKHVPECDRAIRLK